MGRITGPTSTNELRSKLDAGVKWTFIRGCAINNENTVGTTRTPAAVVFIDAMYRQCPQVTRRAM